MQVLDPFHVVRLGLAAVDDVRRRIQQQTYGHRGRADDPLYRIRRVLRRGAEHLTDTGWARLLAGIAAGDEVKSLPPGLRLKSCAPSTGAAITRTPPPGSTTGRCSASTLAYPNCAD